MCHNRMKEISYKADDSIKWKTILSIFSRNVIRIC